ncbi:MAG TPA: EAL domain-containing protein, partial [Acidimicrobiia bacterium]
MRETEERFRLLFESNPVPMWVYDAETLTFLEVNDAAVRAYGYSHDEFLTLRITDIRSVDAIDAFASEPGGPWSAVPHDGVWSHVTRDARVIEVNTTSRLLDFGGRPAVLVMAEDATERLAAERALTYQAMHDALTGLPNRVLLLDRLKQAINRSRRAQTDLAVVFVDLDYFKVVNDAKGHTTGDMLLVEVADRIRAAVRPEDTVARFGGDEFVVVLEGITGAEEAAAICERVRGSLDKPFTIAGSDLVVTASQGIALASPSDSAEDLLRTADAAMYSAKEHGRGRSVVADHAIRTRATRRLQIEADMRRGLDAGEFITYYQPIVALPDCSIIGAEALVRWDDPERGLVQPDQFIAIAEETGLIGRLGQHVLEHALHDAARWPALEPDGIPPFVAVNVSGRQLLIPNLGHVIAQSISSAGIDPDRVHLEITESVLMRDITRSAVLLARIAALGVHLSIDDFGTGYSSLAYLQRLPIESLKVDRSFVELLDRDGRGGRDA